MKRLFFLFEILFVLNCVNAQSYLNPLERISEYNLNGVNEFTSDVWSRGKLFQWGRNTPIPSDNSNLEILSQIESLKDKKVWELNFITSPNNSSNWYNGGSSFDTWTSVVKEANSNGAPVSYYGSNNGDPSPQGYHIPTAEELKAAVYELNFVKIGEIVVDKPENRIDISGKGRLVNYVADYQNVNSKTIVALRFKGTVHATAFKYQWITGKGLEVTAKQAGKGITIGDIANVNFDWSNSVIRRFPIAPQRNNEGKYIDSGRQVTFHTARVTNERVVPALQIVNSTTVYVGRARSYAFSIRPVKNVN